MVNHFTGWKPGIELEKAGSVVANFNFYLAN